MLLHVDNVKFRVKPTGQEIGGIKSRFTKSASIKEVTAKQLAAALTAGKTVQPGITPFSEESRKSGAKGTKDEDFSKQTVFMNDIDNKRTDVPIETPAHVAELLAQYGLKPAFMYETFNSTAALQRFRIALIADEDFTDRAERDRVQAALIVAFPQSDQSCINADRIFFGTDKGLIEGYTDFEAVCSKSDLLAFADAYKDAIQALTEQNVAPKADKPKFGEIIPTGQRHGTLVSFAATVLTKYGVCDKAHEVFMQRVAQCKEPKPDDEIAKIWRDACKHYEQKTSKAPGYIPPAEYATQDFVQSLIPSDYTDVGQAEMFAAVYGNKTKYSDATKWIVYDGTAWREDEIRAQGLVQELTTRQLEIARRMLSKAQAEENATAESGDSEAHKKAKKKVDFAMGFRSFVLAERKTSRIAAALTEARPALQIPVELLDKDPYLLNTPAGTVNLQTGKMKKHDPADYCTKITAVAPGTEGTDLFSDFLRRVTCNDSALERYLQEVAGMCAVGKVLRENLIIAYGGGGNGKSTLFNLLSRVMGDYAGGLSSDVLITNNRNNKKPEYAELRGRRLVIAAELEEGMRLDTATVKKLCSTDPIRGEKKFKAPFDFIPSHSVVLYTNHLPKVGTIDKGTWDRLVVVPFNANLRGMKDEIYNYADYLFDRAGGAVLLWIIKGAKRFIEHAGHIDVPECVKSACEEYRASNDWLHNFLTECCEVSPDYEVMSGDLYHTYTLYCTNVRDYTRRADDFKKALQNAGFVYHRTNKGMKIYGLRQKETDFEPYEGPTPFDNPPPLVGSA
ncbi:MAG: phage/plasmid primase, P4 family [Oscillospiraceae bacterium]|nr:phage/plasmid primase, P4 family [Oscillospiraceae bacterium]